jgi:hypothetical protein
MREEEIGKRKRERGREREEGRKERGRGSEEGRRDERLAKLGKRKKE